MSVAESQYRVMYGAALDPTTKRLLFWPMTKANVDILFDFGTIHVQDAEKKKGGFGAYGVASGILYRRDASAWRNRYAK